MKYILASALLVFTTFTGLKADNSPSTVNVSLAKAYIPNGFDDNDRSQFAVEGLFPNTCFRVGPHALKVDEAFKTITIQQQAYLYSGLCLQIMVPFTQIIDVGLLSDGKYTIFDAESESKLGVLEVGKSKNQGPDDYLYAPINDAYLTYDTKAKTNTIVLTGSFGDRCSDFEEIKVLYQENVIVVQPVIKRNMAGPCPALKTRFLKTVPLTAGTKGIHLLHVRSLNGQAINKIVEAE